MKFLNMVTSGPRWVAGWFVASFWIGAIVAVSAVTSPRRFHDLWRFAFRCITTTAGLRVIVRNERFMARDKGYLYMTNHVNLLEPFIDMPSHPTWVVAIEKKENFKLPIYGGLLRAWGNIPIDRGDSESARESLEVAKDVLAGGTSVAIMPEGTRSPDGQMKAFKKGGFHLAIEAGATIVPYAHKGLEKHIKKGSLLINPTTIELVYTPPIDASQYTKDQIDELMALVRTQIENELSMPFGETYYKPGVSAPALH